MLKSLQINWGVWLDCAWIARQHPGVQRAEAGLYKGRPVGAKSYLGRGGVGPCIVRPSIAPLWVPRVLGRRRQRCQRSPVVALELPNLHPSQ